MKRNRASEIMHINKSKKLPSDSSVILERLSFFNSVRFIFMEHFVCHKQMHAFTLKTFLIALICVASLSVKTSCGLVYGNFELIEFIKPLLIPGAILVHSQFLLQVKISKVVNQLP